MDSALGKQSLGSDFCLYLVEAWRVVAEIAYKFITQNKTGQRKILQYQVLNSTICMLWGQSHNTIHLWGLL